MKFKFYTVTELYIYPIKSLAGIRVETALAQERGFENDHRWMLIDDENQFVTQRKYPVLSQFFPKIKENFIEISYLDKRHEFSISESSNTPIFSKVWDDEATVFEVNNTTSKWFSEMVGFGCKLVKIGNRIHGSSQLNKSLPVSLADGYPYLVLGTESLNFLNKKLDEKMTIQRFRPNIVIETDIPHEEDSFENFQIGLVKFKNAKPCGRCIMVNTNPENGIVNKEPLNTLSTYRKVNNLVYFGNNVISLNEGEIKVGDTLVF